MVHPNPELIQEAGLFEMCFESGIGSIVIIMVIAWLIKHKIRIVPKEWLPLINIITGTLLMFLHTPTFYAVTGPFVDMVSGCIYGLAATGIYETHKQIIRRRRKKDYIKGNPEIPDQLNLN